MKKVFLMLATAMLGIMSASATDWYMVGNQNGLTWGDAAADKLTATATAGEYTITKAKVSGEIKFKTAGSWNQALGSNGQKLKEGVPYTASQGGTVGNINVDGIISNATIVINENTRVIKITGQAAENEYSNVYLVGDFGTGWNENITTYPLSLKAGTTNVWEGEYSLTAAKSYFKMKAGTLIYGTGGNDIAVALDHQYTASQSGNAFNITPGKYLFSFVLDKNANTGKLTVTDAGKMDLPETLFVIGNVKGGAFVANNTVALAKGTTDGVFSGEVTFTGGDSDTDSWFQLCTATGANASDWAGLGVRYGAPKADATPNETPSAINFGDVSWKIPNGTYTITANLADMTITAVKKTVEPEPEPMPEATFDFTNYDFIKLCWPEVPALDDWTASSTSSYVELPATMDVDGFTLSVAKTAEAAQATRFWHTAAGEINLRFYKNNTLTIAVPKGKLLKKIVFKSYSNTINLDKLSTSTEGAPALVHAVNTTDKYSTTTWTAPELGTATRAEAQAYTSVDFTASGTVYMSTIDVEMQDIPVGIEGVEIDENAPVRYFNLQGVEVNEPAAGLYIRVQGSKAQKVIIRK